MANKIDKFKRLLKIAIASAVAVAAIYIGVNKLKDWVNESFYEKQYKSLSKQEIARIDSIKTTGSVSKEEIQRNVNLMGNIIDGFKRAQNTLNAIESIKKGNKEPMLADLKPGYGERIKILEYILSETEKNAKEIDSKILPTTEVKARIAQLQKVLEELKKDLL